MARTFRYSDILSIVSKQFPRIVEDQYASICSNMATNLIWYAYDWRESLLTLPPFWLIPGEQDYKPPATVIPADFGGLDALDAAPAISGRLAIVASQDDLSARESLERIARTAPLDGARALLLPGRAHGRAVLTADAEGPARRLMRETFDRAWRQ